MSVLSKDDFMNYIKNLVGEDTSDETMSIIEDMSDTYDNLSTNSNAEDWETKYNELDKTWREKYKARFFDTGVPEEITEETSDETENDVKNFDDLFNESEDN